jgi:hypothetical protein
MEVNWTDGSEKGTVGKVREGMRKEGKERYREVNGRE